MRVLLAAVAGTAVLATTATAAAPAPRLVSATVVGDRLTLVFDRPLARPPGGSIGATINGRAVRPTRSVVSGRRLQLVLPFAVYGDDLVRVAGRNVRAADRRRVLYFQRDVQNRSAPGCTFDPGPPIDSGNTISTRAAILSVHVDFADARANQFQSAMKLSAVDTWIRDLSYGRAAVAGTEHPGVVRMAKNHADYAFTGAWGARKTFFQDLVIRLDAEVDFSRYDAVFVTTTRRPGSPTPERVVVAPPGTGVTADGKELRYFAAFGDPTPNGGLAGILNLAGLQPAFPDQIGVWADATANRSGKISLLGLQKRRLGWLDPTQVRCLRAGQLEATLAPLAVGGGIKLVVVPNVGTRSTVVLENRQRTGLDAAQCAGGILAYDVTPGSPYGTRLLHGPLPQPQPALRCGALATAPWDFRRGDSTTVLGVNFEVLDVLADGSYRLRVRR